MAHRGTVLAFALSALAVGVGPRPCAAQVNAKVGVGSGLPYGTVLAGAGAEIEIRRRVSLLGGVGVGRDSPWAYGVRLYLLPPERRWRPHVSGLRWTEGYGGYLGVDHDIGTPGRFVATYGLGFGDVNLEGRVGAMAGIGYRW